MFALEPFIEDVHELGLEKVHPFDWMNTGQFHDTIALERRTLIVRWTCRTGEFDVGVLMCAPCSLKPSPLYAAGDVRTEPRT